MPKPHWLSLKTIDEAICAYAAEHDGCGPRSVDGDARKYELPFLWSSIDSILSRSYQTTLIKRAGDLGLHHSRRDKLSLLHIDEAMRAYARDHGRYPTQHSGPAAKYLGMDKKWSAVDCCLRKMGTSLTRRAAELRPAK